MDFSDYYDMMLRSISLSHRINQFGSPIEVRYEAVLNVIKIGLDIVEKFPEEEKISILRLELIKKIKYFLAEERDFSPSPENKRRLVFYLRELDPVLI